MGEFVAFGSVCLHDCDFRLRGGGPKKKRPIGGIMLRDSFRLYDGLASGHTALG